MKEIAFYVNEKKREFDSLKAVQNLQPRLLGYEIKTGVLFVREDRFQCLAPGSCFVLFRLATVFGVFLNHFTFRKIRWPHCSVE